MPVYQMLFLQFHYYIFLLVAVYEHFCGQLGMYINCILYFVMYFYWIISVNISLWIQ